MGHLGDPRPQYRVWTKITYSNGRYTLDGTPYLTRRELISTPWFGVFIHWIHREDLDRDMHNHPWPFLAIALKGGYMQQYQHADQSTHHLGSVSTRTGWRGRLNWMPRSSRHRIAIVQPAGAVTLVFRGPKTQHWGFFTPTGFVPWENYVDHWEPS